MAKTIETDFMLLLKIGLVTGLPIALVMMQPDLGTALVLLAIMTGIIFVSGISWKIITAIYGFGITLAGVILYFVIWAPQILEKYLHVKSYQFDRIYAWIDPVNHAAGYHLSNSLKAIGSGQLIGKGFAGRKVYIPESHTDFIFSVIGEEYGFLGGSIVIGLFFLLIYHLTKTALETTDSFNTLYLCWDYQYDYLSRFSKHRNDHSSSTDYQGFPFRLSVMVVVLSWVICLQWGLFIAFIITIAVICSRQSKCTQSQKYGNLISN